MSDKWTTEDLKFWGIVGLGAVAVTLAGVYLLPPLISILKLPGEIIDAPGKVLDKIKEGKKQNDIDSEKLRLFDLENKKLSVPGMTTDDLKKIIDKKVIAKFGNVPVRSSAHSNATVLKYIPVNSSAGYVWSAANEKLGSKNIIWFYLSATPGGDPFGWIRMDDVNVSTGVNGIGCDSCIKQSIGCNTCINKMINY